MELVYVIGLLIVAGGIGVDRAIRNAYERGLREGAIFEANRYKNSLRK